MRKRKRSRKSNQSRQKLIRIRRLLETASDRLADLFNEFDEAEMGDSADYVLEARKGINDVLESVSSADRASRRGR